MTSKIDNEIPWIIIDKFFQDNKNVLVKHHLDSYNSFFNNGINQIFKEKNPMKIMKQLDPETKIFKLQADLYFGGREGDKIYIGKPIIFDQDREHYMFPNEARLRNMTYSVTLHYDVDIEYTIYDENDEAIKTSTTLEKIYLGRFPIMLNSDLCILNGLDPMVKYNMGECKNDLGGYFIIDGKEKAIISQEKFANNMLYIRDKYNDLYSHSAEIRSVSEDTSKPIRTVAIRIVSPSSKLSNNQIVITVPNVRKPVPLFILMRALGVISDKDIIKYCLINLEKYESYMSLFIPSIHDAGKIFTQETALKFISTFTKGKTIPQTLDILMNYFLPHIGTINFQDKAFFIGYMVLELLKVYSKDKKATDRDSFLFKRVELPGTLLSDLFKEYYTLQQREIYQKIDKEYYYKKGIYINNFTSLIEANTKEIFKERIVESGFKKGFKGNWGAEEHTKRPGVVQDLNRLSYNSYISHMRKINLPMDSSAKVIGPRLLHSSQWGIIDPVDTPDGGNAGLHKHMAISAHITSGCSGIPLINWLRDIIKINLLEECTLEYLSSATKIMINGAWIGVIDNPEEVLQYLKISRRNALIPIYTSIRWDITSNIIFLYTDAGRMCRPIFYIDENTGKASYNNDKILEKLRKNEFTWSELVSGFNKKKDEYFNVNACKLYSNISDLYYEKALAQLLDNQAIIEYIDTSETEALLICVDPKNLEEQEKSKSKKSADLLPYTHLEIHGSLLLGVMGNQIIFPENNQLPRDLFACGQSKQAVSLYHSNYLTRIDKMGVILNYGQIPLLKSRYMKYINNEQHPYGVNAIVAIAVYGGYNVEDAILFNEASVARGIFRTTYYNMYEAREESSKVGNKNMDSKFANIESDNVIGLRPGYDYSDLDQYGLIKENTLMDDKKVIIGKITNSLIDPDVSIDNSIVSKKGQLGYVDKSFITEGEQGFRIAKVRIREERVPNIGDKFCSRCGQKGTIGLIIPERDMPFTKEGIRPDIIVNPHALPSRMTIGQLIEMLQAKVCCLYGAFADCTAFVNDGPKNELFGEMLTNIGYKSSGNEILYNGQTGEQLESEIFMGPSYYMRLKHMVKDKINYRAQGPRTVLTRQPVQGRANDGGLRIGEMERDGIIGYGAARFLQESMMERGDAYYMAICNKTGTIAIYNENLNLFLSPMADGPIKFTGTLDDGLNIDYISKYGRSFSIVRVPYAFKLLMQELQGMNIQMRIITEENIDQVTSLSFSSNINIMLGLSPEADAQELEKTISRTQVHKASQVLETTLGKTITNKKTQRAKEKEKKEDKIREKEAYEIAQAQSDLEKKQEYAEKIEEQENPEEFKLEDIPEAPERSDGLSVRPESMQMGSDRIPESVMHSNPQYTQGLNVLDDTEDSAKELGEDMITRLDSIKETLENLTDKKVDQDENKKISDILEIKSQAQDKLEQEGLVKPNELLSYISPSGSEEDKGESNEKKSLIIHS